MPSQSTAEGVPSAPQDLHVYLLGPPRVEVDDVPLRVPRCQVRGLLYRLAAQSRRVLRERLCFLFWPDVSESKARRSLSHLLTHLRRALPEPDLVVASGDRIGLDAERAWSDLIAFNGLLDRAEGIESLSRAADLYRGRFLAGFSLAGSPEFETWILQQQLDCERRYLDLLSTLIERHAARRDYDLAIASARSYLAVDGLAEDIHRRLIALYGAAGNRSAALHQFERCAAVLERELGVRPLPETRAAYENSLQERRPSVGFTALDLAWTTLPSLDVPLVGRDGACRHLSKALSQARSGRGQIVLISGEPGIGKSRLVEEFARDCGERVLVLAASAAAGQHPLPYQPVAELFRSLPDWHRLTSVVQPVWLAEAARVLPELGESRRDLPPPLPVEPDEARGRLLEALCRMMLGLASRSSTTLICIDDLHWADSATCDWLVCLATRMAACRGDGVSVEVGRILILGSYRCAQQERLVNLRRSLLRLGMLSEISLTGLELPAVLEIVHHFAGARPGAPVLARRLHQATGGNPFFLLETLGVLLEAREPTQNLAAFDALPLPNTVRQAIEARLERVDSKSRQVLEAGAVLGLSFDFDLVRRTAGRGEMEAVDALDEAVARHLLVEGPSGYRFRHALIRQTLEASLGPVRRSLLHRRAARALAGVEPQPTARIARHFDRGGNAERALHYYLQADDEAQEMFAWQEAESIQTRMLELLDRLDPDCAQPDYLALRGEVLTSRAHLRFLQGRLEDRDADLATLAALAKMSRDQELELQALVHRVRYLNLDANYRDALSVAEEGLTLSDRLDRDGAAVRLLAQIGFAHYFLGRPQAALTALESALATIGDDGAPAMQGRIAHILGYVYFHLGDYARSLRYQQQAYACHRGLEDQNRVAWDGLDIGALFLELGDSARSKEYLTEHLDLARRIGAQPAEGYGLTLLGSWKLHQGDYVGAGSCFREARSIQQRLRSEHGIVAAELGVGLTLYHLGELPRGRRLLRRAVERARSIAHRRRLAESLVALGLLEIEAESPEAARMCLAEAVELARDGECWESVAAGLVGLARVERARGKLRGASEHAGEAISVARERELSTFEVLGHAELGLVRLARGDLKEALAETRQAVADVSKLNEAWIGSEEVHRAHVRILHALDRTEEAREQAQLAAAVVQEKAERIPDPNMRQRYRQHVEPGAPELKT